MKHNVYHWVLGLSLTGTSSASMSAFNPSNGANLLSLGRSFYSTTYHDSPYALPTNSIKVGTIRCLNSPYAPGSFTGFYGSGWNDVPKTDPNQSYNRDENKVKQTKENVSLRKRVSDDEYIFQQSVTPLMLEPYSTTLYAQSPNRISNILDKAIVLSKDTILNFALNM